MTITRRSGKTLIEMVLIIVVMGTVTTIAGKTMVTVLNKERSGREAYLANSDRSRFAADFRRDVNAAESVELSGERDDADRQIDLNLPDDRLIEYRLQDDELTRLEQQGERFLSRERYHIACSEARFGISPGDPEVVFLTATIAHRPEHSSAPPRRLRFEAVTGKNLRFREEETP